jgi:hypothetical protein
MGDNFSSDIQPGFFNEYSRAYHTEAIRCLHSTGKYVAVHIDGRLRGARTIANANENRIELMRDLVEKYCRY